MYTKPVHISHTTEECQAVFVVSSGESVNLEQYAMFCWYLLEVLCSPGFVIICMKYSMVHHCLSLEMQASHISSFVRLSFVLYSSVTCTLSSSLSYF